MPRNTHIDRCARLPQFVIVVSAHPTTSEATAMHPLLFPEIARQHQAELMADAQRSRLRRHLRPRPTADTSAADVQTLSPRTASPAEIRTFPTDRKAA